MKFSVVCIEKEYKKRKIKLSYLADEMSLNPADMLEELITVLNVFMQYCRRVKQQDSTFNILTVTHTNHHNLSE